MDPIMTQPWVASQIMISSRLATYPAGQGDIQPASCSLGTSALETWKGGMDLGMDLLKIPTRYVFFNFEDSNMVLFVVVKICIDNEINLNQHSPIEI